MRKLRQLAFVLLGFWAAAAPVRAQVCAPRPAGMVSWWPFDEASGTAAADVVGGKHGSLTGTAPVAGMVFNARRFVPGDSMSADGSGVLDIAGDQVTIAAWIKLENNPYILPAGLSSFTANVGKTTFPDKQSYLITFNSGPFIGLPRDKWRFEYILTNASGVRVHNQSTFVDVLVDGRYHHFAMTYDGTLNSVRLYVDGALAGTFAGPGGNLKSLPGEPVRMISEYGPPPGAPFSIDEVQIFARALGHPEIAAIYAAGAAGTCPPLTGASAGADQTVCEGDLVDLVGSVSPDVATVTAGWRQIGGATPQILSGADTRSASFAAQTSSPSGETATFEFSASDGLSIVADQADATIKHRNRAPVADAGADRTVQEAAVVQLDASFGSFDPEGDALGYSWIQAAGPPVLLSGAYTATPTFTAPSVSSAGAQLVFRVTITDSPEDADCGGTLSAHDDLVINVSNVNQPPVADAGAEQTVNEGTLVQLDCSRSSDPDGEPISFSWTQVTGTPVALSAPDSDTPTFTAPAVAGHAHQSLTFQCHVSDGALGAADVVQVTVRDVNAPPDCTLARAEPSLLWPPNHQFSPVGVVGVTDPNDPVRITVSAVSQDEPTNGLGDGDSTPDALAPPGGVLTPGSPLLLRRERSGTGDGRVYRVSFVADDGVGGTCQGTVLVGVPHGRRDQPFDSGPTYDSMQP